MDDILDTMLAKILETESKVIILDILGVASVDSAVANQLIKITRATRLMGCDSIISGISPDAAQTDVQLGIDLGEVITTKGIEIIAEDHGPGITNIDAVMEDGYSVLPNSLGLGLPGVKRLMDEFTIETGLPGCGVKISATKWI